MLVVCLDSLGCKDLFLVKWLDLDLKDGILDLMDGVLDLSYLMGGVLTLSYLMDGVLDLS